MDKELTIITEPEELIAWADTFDILLNPSIEDAAILLKVLFLRLERRWLKHSTSGKARFNHYNRHCLII